MWKRGLLVTGLVDFNETDFLSARVLRSHVRSYVGHVYRYHRQYIYDVVLYQYQQDLFPTDHDHFRNILTEILGDAQQVTVASLKIRIALVRITTSYLKSKKWLNSNDQVVCVLGNFCSV